MKKQTGNILKILMAMITVAFVAASFVGIIKAVTEKPIQESQNRMIADSIKDVVSGNFDNNPYEEKIVIRKDKDTFTLYPAREEGHLTSLVMKSVSNKGYGGQIEVLVNFLLDGTVGGFKVINHKETPGLGSKVNDDSFKKGVVGKKPATKAFKVRQDGGEIDAITGATITSRALIDAIQKAYDGYQKFIAGMNHEEQ